MNPSDISDAVAALATMLGVKQSTITLAFLILFLASEILGSMGKFKSNSVFQLFKNTARAGYRRVRPK